MASSQGMAAYAAPSLFQPHLTRQAIRDAHKKKIPPLLGYYGGIGSTKITRWLAPLGFDVVWVDWEHSSMNVETMTTIVHEAIFMSQGRTIPFVRVPGHDHASIGWALDAGASIIVPQVETVEEAKHVVSAAKFGSKAKGTRSAPPFRLMRGVTDTTFEPGRDIYEAMNHQAAIMIQIESRAGIDNLDAILTEVPDIDIVWLGSLDCRVEMGLPSNMGQGGDEPEWLAYRQKFFDIIDKHDMPYGGFAFSTPPFGTPESFKKATERMSFTIMAADTVALASMGESLKHGRELVAPTSDKKVNGQAVNGEKS
ncbi:Phosphoenolpyruvate/pyruvate domain-containing protein [Trichoderma citrinoviride]|uniref:Phosphoenolpyruvate/pyruvate domain-containing protein n=1 Tax=Trichoderma citrinoviride TaxID=58853 RepID=A0A2T4B6Z5_9HYPO|nr:Phosphoenolpyruvate/pyruvate domain-containing protein [Trichoderma citrinoviride]PTB65102.1 Phosphoenolpyruvate/pyruvate domain-containing protein [Trichoderma citrinoviride]